MVAIVSLRLAIRFIDDLAPPSLGQLARLRTKLDFLPLASGHTPPDDAYVRKTENEVLRCIDFCVPLQAVRELQWFGAISMY